MSETDYSVGDAARIVGIEAGRIRGWLSSGHFDGARRTATRRVLLSMRDLRIFAVATKLLDHGFEQGHALRQATSIVDRMAAWRSPPLVAIFSRDPNVSPVIIPQDGMPETDVVIIVALAPLFAELDARAAK